eukprot:GEZU01011150.1.p2 GENE.GEZU01011150.1~~GEZU01011150.1.p2  ORF type:complete len:119 (-),score=39.65 GEZU01011150.1:243-599(-)
MRVQFAMMTNEARDRVQSFLVPPGGAKQFNDNNDKFTLACSICPQRPFQTKLDSIQAQFEEWVNILDKKMAAFSFQYQTTIQPQFRGNLQAWQQSQVIPFLKPDPTDDGATNKFKFVF